MLNERFWNKVDKSGDCWLWTASVVAGPRGGYGQYRVGKKMRKAHVVSYEDAVGPLPVGHQLDHLCRNRACVNPDHLEPVTQSENQRRSPLTTAGKTECVRGHDLADAYLSRGRRICRTCALADARRRTGTPERRAYQREWLRKKRAAQRSI